MDLSHLSALVRMVQSERPEDAAKSSLYVVKAKRGMVTFTKCDATDATHVQPAPAMRVSGRNVKADTVVTAFFQGRRPIPEAKV